MKKLFIGVYNPSIILTYIGMFSSIYGIGSLMNSDLTNSMDPIIVPMILLILAGVCDMFDGRVARACKRTEKEAEFGIQLDSLADTVSFVVYPAIILMYATDFSLPGIIIAMFYSFAGVMRLGWFNITTEENKGFYMGLPVTFSALLIPVFFLLFRILNVSPSPAALYVFWLAIGIAFISNFKLKKPGLKFSLAMLLTAIIAIMGYLFI